MGRPMKGKSTAGITSPGPGSEITSQELTSGMNFPILQLQELHRSHVFPDVDHPSKALSNVFPEKRQGGIFAGLHMPACRFSSPLPAAASTGVSRDNGRVNRERPDITDLGNDDRRLSRRFYSPSLLPEADATDQHGRVSRRALGAFPGRGAGRHAGGRDGIGQSGLGRGRRGPDRCLLTVRGPAVSVPRPVRRWRRPWRWCWRRQLTASRTRRRPAAR